MGLVSSLVTGITLMFSHEPCGYESPKEQNYLKERDWVSAENLCVEGLLPKVAGARGGTFRKGLDHGGSGFINRLIHPWLHNVRTCWEVLGTQEAGGS